ncbi:MAG: PUA domain-containing protein [Candidatus Helarchaeota archaeon]
MKSDHNLQPSALAENFLYPISIIKRFLERYGERTLKILSALKTPSRNFTIRSNLLKISTEGLINELKNAGIRTKKHDKVPDAIILPVKGPFKIPILEKKVIIDKFASESVLCGSDLYIPGILNFDKFKEGDEVTIINKETQIPIGIGLATISHKSIRQLKKGVALQTIKSLYKIPNVKKLAIYKAGLFYNQSLPAILTSHILNPEPEKNEIIIDLCAGIGGKSTHIAQLMENKGRVLAFDRSKNKIEKLKQNCLRLGITNITAITKDARFMLDRLENSADRVLIDPPCTALGVRPKLYETKNEKNIIDSARYQKYFLHMASKLVKRSGIVVYSTCTLSPEENELNVKYMLDKLKFKIIEQNKFLGSIGEPSDNNMEFELLQRFYPDIHETPGFFIAKLKSIK